MPAISAPGHLHSPDGTAGRRRRGSSVRVRVRRVLLWLWLCTWVEGTD